MDSEAQAWEEGVDAWVERVRELGAHPHDEAILALLPAPAGLTLDAGCGEGRLTRLLSSLGHDAVGVDRSSRLVEEARRADPDGRYAVASIDALPLDDRAAALVVCVNVLPHVVDLEPAVRELARVLRDDGALVVGLAHPVMLAGEYDDDSRSLRLEHYFDASPEVVELGHHHVHHQPRTIEEYLRAFFGVGLVLTDVREVPARGADVPRYLDLRLERRSPST
ncbi:MAG TPA: class I SAM-dependent methyltransferase [Gaiellaceae bacterium]